jgi:hypothetical protein
LRPGHFHSGIDIKTQGVSGHKLFSVADGYVSRIKISANGYGKALYIHHPELGITSVYAHLSGFNKTLKEYIRKEQYQNKTFEIQIFPEKHEISIKQGELIGYSGNSGSSQGPHLHFEIRNLDNQHPLNPLVTKYNIRDDIPPKIFQVGIYPLNKNSRVNGKHEKILINTRQNESGFYSLNSEHVPEISGDIGIGVKTYDFLNGSHNWCGVYQIELKVDSTIIYSHTLDEFAFRNTRFINSHIDYEEKVKNNASIQRLYLQPNNNLGIYKYVKNRGQLKFDDDTTHLAEIIVHDANGNSSKIEFQLKNTTRKISSDTSWQPVHEAIFPYENENNYYTGELKLDFPPMSFYDTLLFEYNKLETNHKMFFSDIHQVHNIYTPVHKYFSLSIKMKNTTNALKDKLFIAKIEEKDDYAFQGGEVVNGFISTRVREFGDYVVMADTVNPTIKAISNLEQITKTGKISFRITDDLSGIDTYNGFIDGEWVLFEYDAKNDLLFHDLKETKIASGRHEVELYIGDKRNNIATYYSEFQIK